MGRVDGKCKWLWNSKVFEWNLKSEYSKMTKWLIWWKELGHRRLLNIAIIFHAIWYVGLLEHFMKNYFFLSQCLNPWWKVLKNLSWLEKLLFQLLFENVRRSYTLIFVRKNNICKIFRTDLSSRLFKILFEKSHLLTVYTLYCVYTCKIQIRTPIFSQPSFRRVNWTYS